jgi:hypothetical protein
MVNYTRRDQVSSEKITRYFSSPVADFPFGEAALYDS